jgi:hypothetical protein
MRGVKRVLAGLFTVAVGVAPAPPAGRTENNMILVTRPDGRQTATLLRPEAAGPGGYETVEQDRPSSPAGWTRRCST